MSGRSGESATPARALVFLTGVVAVGLLLAGCGGGGGGDDSPQVLSSGQVGDKLQGYTVVERQPHQRSADASKKASAQAESASGGGSATPASTLPGQSDATTPTTAKSAVPIKKSGNAVQDLIAASGKFRDCLNQLNVKFIGAPDASNPQSPTNDPDYIKALSTCAARSNIVQYLNAAQAEQDTLTPKQIKQQNEGYVLWRDCMVKRGWKIPTPTPDEKGRLFTFGQNTKPPEPPPGKDFFNSKDLAQCSAQATKEFKKKHPNESLNG
jgi:hypothetical protein